jgi:5-(carboxyamino)imidazole ribonucleotide synthase
MNRPITNHISHIAPPFDIGFLGGGQLARMSIMAAQRMGLKCISIDPSEHTPASEIAPAFRGSLESAEDLKRLLEQCRRVTLESEFVPAGPLRKALESRSLTMIPSIANLEVVQDKLFQREAYTAAGVPSPKAIALNEQADLAQIGFPMVLKSRFGGYDGKGTRYARTPEELESYRSEWGAGGWLAEEFVPFKRELAVMVYLSPFGDGAFPTMETVQTNHVCDLVYPADVDASSIALAAARAMGGFGLFGVELFEKENGEILVNEIAPRPHNSGHYTLDWGGVSQFDQHVRIVMGLPPLEPKGNPVCMANLLGQPGAGDYRNGLEAAMEDPRIRVHWYGKAESRPGRKMGHLNAVGENIVQRAIEARERFYAAWCA